MLQLDIEAGRFLLAAVTCERKGDVEQAVQLYVKNGRVDLAVELLLRNARAAVLWSGSGGGGSGKMSYDWPPQPPGDSSGKYIEQVNELLLQASAGGGDTGNSDDVSGMRLMTSALASCKLEADLLSYVSSSSAKGSRDKCTSSRTRGSDAGEGGSQGPLLDEWVEWKARLEAPGLAENHGSRVSFARLCLLRLLSGDALSRVDSLVRPPTQTQRRPTGTHATVGHAVPGSVSVQPENLSTITTATLELLRLWSAYRRFQTDVLRVLSRQQVAAASDRDAAVLAAVQSYHVVSSPTTAAAEDGGVSAASGGDGTDSFTSFTAGSTTGGAAPVLQLGCPATAAWVLQAKDRLGLTFTTDAVVDGGAARSAAQLSAADFAAAASLYWRSELKDRSKRTLECLLALAALLVPDYEAFKAIGVDRSRRQDGGEVANRVLDMTQLRAQVLVAAVQEAVQLVKVGCAHGGRKS